MKNKLRLLLLGCTAWLAATDTSAAIRYARAGGSGSATGADWSNASGDIQALINLSSTTVVDTIWVAAGTYKPMRPANNPGSVEPVNRNNAFCITKNVVLLGGFPASGSPGLGNRDAATHTTILSGDINSADDSDNAYHVLMTIGTNLNSSLHIDGFTVTGGNANGTGGFISVNDYLDIYNNRGGGWFNTGSPKLTNITIRNNHTSYSGAGVNNVGSPQLSNILIYDNLSDIEAGGWFNGAGNPHLTNVTITGNSANLFGGGGWHNEDGNPELSNVTISSNSAVEAGGGWYNGNGNPQINNSTISGNSAIQYGGGWYNGNGNPQVTNTIICGNSIVEHGGGWYNGNGNPQINNVTIGGNWGSGWHNNDGNPQLNNSIIYGNNSGFEIESGSPGISYSLVQGRPADATNLSGSTDPKFVDLQQASPGNPTNAGNYRLQATSFAINTGNNALATTTTDLAGNNRIQQNRIDMGAYESPFLNPNATLSGLSLSKGSLSPAFASSTTAYTAWVAGCTSSITLTPAATDAFATITVNGNAVASGNPSGTIALATGSNTITVIVTAEDGITQQTYTLTVIRIATPSIIAPDQMVCNGTATEAVALGAAISGYLCGVAAYEGNSMTLQAPTSTIFTGIDFASYGTSTGNCGSFSYGDCHAASSMPIVSALAIGKASFTVAADYNVFGDSCYGTAKRLAVQAAYEAVPVTYTWTNDNTATGLGSNGTGSIPTFNATNNSNIPVTAHITITPTYTFAGETCIGEPKTFTITVKPSPTINIIANQTTCNGLLTTTVNPSGPIANTIYTWTNDNPSIGLPAVGAGIIDAFTAVNTTAAPLTATVTVTPVPGGTQTFSNPANIAIPASGPANPYPSAISVSGLSGNLSHVAVKLNGFNHTFPADLDILLVGPGGQNALIMSDVGGGEDAVGVNLTLDDNAPASLPLGPTLVSGIFKPTNINSGNDLFNAPAPAPSGGSLLSVFNGTDPNGTWLLYIRDDAGLDEGNLSGGWELVLSTDACPGTPTTFTYTVNPTPTVNEVNNQEVCHGAATSAVAFDGAVTGTVYNWTNDNASIGLAASGSGTIPSFTAIHTGDVPVTANITVTPTYTNAGQTCSGEPITFTYTVNDTALSDQSQTVYDYELPITFGSQSLTMEGNYTEMFSTVNGCDSTVNLALTVIYTYDITGKVHNDVNGMNGNPSTINGNGTNAGGLKAVLIDALADTVVTYTNVSGNGNFSFENQISNTYKIIITNENINGNTVPLINLPGPWQPTGEKLGAGIGSDGMADGMLDIGLLTQDVSVRFGIQQPPIAQNSSTTAQLNPGSNASVNLPNSNFIMSDPSPGAVTQIRFTSFPTGTDIFYINGNSYNSSNWPGNVEVNAQYLFGNLLMPNVSIDPTTGPQQVVISYQAIDAAGAASNTATITMPFFGIEIGGTVHNNFEGANGSPLNTIVGPSTNGGGLYAILSDDISNAVIATDEVNNNGVYQFTGIDKGYYTVRLSTTDALPGVTTPASGINPGWKATAEKNGTGAGNDGFADSKIYLGLQSANNSNVRFGIQQPPTASPATAASRLNPNGNINYTVPASTFVTVDAAPGAVTSLYFSGALPANANKLVLNGVTYSATNPLPPAGVHVAVSSGSPVNPILVDPVNGNVTVTISYNAVDAAGMMSAVTIASQPFHKTAAMAGSNNTGGNGAAPANPGEEGLSAFRAIDIQIYPNPAKDKIFIKINDLSFVKALHLLDIHGRELRMTEQAIESGLDMSGLAAGTYLLQVELKNGNSQRFKVVKE